MALYINGKQISGGGGGGNTNSVELTYAEYQALTPEQQLDGTEYFITDINGDGQQFQPIIYSEEEREIGVWTDGRPVYQKTVTGTFSNATYLNISVADLDVLAILEIEGILLASDSANIVNIGSDDAGAVRFSHTAITPGSALEYITISKNNASSYGTASQVYATLRYIKSTDTAGSGTWTPQGVPAVHYSEDEQVVGTWIDGNTLYERTIVLRENGVDKYTFTGNMSKGGTYAVGLTNIDKIWLEGLYAKRGRSGDTVYTDIDNNNTEVITVFKHSDGSFYFRDTFTPTDIILIIRYTKSST